MNLSMETAPIEAMDLDEAQLPGIPRFVNEMAADYPELAEEIAAKVPGLVKATDTLMGIPGFTEFVLEQVEYISFQEEEEFFQGIRTEVEEALSSNDEVCFLVHPSGNSGKYIYSQILRGLTEDQRQHIRAISAIEFNDELDKNTLPEHIFVCDDSSNSGSQLSGQTLNMLGPYSRKSGPFVDLAEADHPLNIHVRLMRATEHAEARLNIMRDRFSVNDRVNIDIQTKPMPSMSTVAEHFDLNAKGVTSVQRSLFISHHNMGTATLGIFAHKIQDNLSPLLVGGRLSKDLEAHGVKPLFESKTAIDYPEETTS